MKSLQHAPSKVAAAAVGLALRINHLPPWSAALRKYSRYTEESLAPVQQVPPTAEPMQGSRAVPAW